MPRFPRLLLTTTAAPPPAAVVAESDFVVVLAALLCALICVVGLIAMARCAWLRRGPGDGTQPAAPANSAKGLKKKTLKSLPKFTFGSGEASGGGSGDGGKFKSVECAICLGEFADGEEVRVLPQCGHVFHVGCIDTWLGSHSSCPSCRQVLVVARCSKCGRFPGGSADKDGKTTSDSQVGGEVGHCSYIGVLP